MSPIITRDEVKKHNNERDIWIIIHNEVYDVTKFLNEHPGGADSLMDYAGKDGTQGFEDVGHSDDAREMMKQYRVGKLDSRECIVVTSWTSKKGKNDCIVYQAASCGPVPKDDKKEKSWRTFDGSRDSKPKPPKSDMKPPSTPRAEPRVQTIVVPRESGSKLKWAIFALGAAILIGIAVKKYMG